VAVIETHATVHPAAPSFVYLATAGWTFRYVRGSGAGDDDFTFYLGFTHFILNFRSQAFHPRNSSRK
jgi:hypothetical protein